MNTMQEILLVIVKSMFPNVFKGCISPREEYFMKCMKTSSYFKKLRMAKTMDGSEFIIWDSFIGETIACRVTLDEGFFFSDLSIFDKEPPHMSYPVNNKEKMEALQKDVTDIQTLFTDFSIDAKKFFK